MKVQKWTFFRLWAWISQKTWPSTWMFLASLKAYLAGYYEIIFSSLSGSGYMRSVGLNMAPRKLVFLSFLRTRWEYFFAIRNGGTCRSLGSECQISSQSVDISVNTGHKTENGGIRTLEGHSSTTGRTWKNPLGFLVFLWVLLVLQISAKSVT